MAEFKKLSEVEQIEAVSDNATVLVEDGGDIKRVPTKAVGGGAATVVIEVVADENGATISCNTMTFETMKESLLFGVPMYIVTRVIMPENPTMISSCFSIMYFPVNVYFGGAPELIRLQFDDTTLYWMEDGITNIEPSGGK